MNNNRLTASQNRVALLTFLAIASFYFFEAIQFGYFNVLAPSFLKHHIYSHQQIAALSSAYMYGIIAGLFPVGLIDQFSIRKIMLWTIFGSVIGAFVLYAFDSYSLRWLARFICGFFGGAFSFVGGIRIVALLYPKKFNFYFGVFLSAGTLGGLVCLYPLLLAINTWGISSAIGLVAIFGFIVMLFNILYLHPKEDTAGKQNSVLSKHDWLFILRNPRNWLDVIMIILLDTPVSILGTLWGVVILMNVFGLSDLMGTWVMTAFFVGMMVGYPLWGRVSDRFHDSKWIIFCGALCNLVIILLMLLDHQLGTVALFALFLLLGFFSSCQTLGFTWLTKGMRTDLIGRNSAFNSMLFMGANGGFKQFSAYLLLLAPLAGHASGNNLLVLIAIAMLIVAVYVLFRSRIFLKFKMR